ncbi:MAG: YeeE/YedE family protein [Planctomycetes bacterium]|nr:YeeE/YedE family protein [Planctomycetota bacterium]
MNMILENPIILGLIIGALFGAALFLSGLANPDKIIGTLRLKDLHAMRVIIVFLVIGMIGVMLLERYGLEHLGIKSTGLLSALVGGAFLGVGFGLTGYCPGTGLACAITGRIDALITVLGMFVGAYVYIRLYHGLVVPLDKIWDYGKIRWPETLGIQHSVTIAILVVLAIICLIMTRCKKKAE